jgi:hypothetical protein
VLLQVADSSDRKELVMETQTKWMIGGAVVLAAGGYYWFFVRPKGASAQAKQIIDSIPQQAQLPQQQQGQGAPPPSGGSFDPSSILSSQRVNVAPVSFTPQASGSNNYPGYKF